MNRRTRFLAVFSADAKVRSAVGEHIDSDALSAFKSKLSEKGRLPERSNSGDESPGRF